MTAPTTRPSLGIAALAALVACSTPTVRTPPTSETAAHTPAAAEAPTPDGPTPRWRRMLEPYGGDPETVRARVEAVVDAARDGAWSVSDHRHAGGRTFWTSMRTGRPTLCVAEPSGDEVRRLPLPGPTPLSSAPIPSPNGSFVAVAGETGWTVLDAELGTPLAELTAGTTWSEEHDPLVWSRDGDALFRTAERPAGRVVEHVPLAGTAAANTLWELPAEAYVERMELSDDGSSLLVLTEPDGVLTSVDLEGGPVAELAREVDDVVGASGPAVWIVRDATDLVLIDRTRSGGRRRAGAATEDTATVIARLPGRIEDAILAGGSIVAIVSEFIDGPVGRPPVLRVHDASGAERHSIELQSGSVRRRLSGRPDSTLCAVTDGGFLLPAQRLDLDVGSGEPAPSAVHDGLPLLTAERAWRGPRTVYTLRSADPVDAPVLQLRFTDLQLTQDRALAWVLLGGSLVLEDNAEEGLPTASDATLLLVDRLIELGLQPRADVLERLGVHGQLGLDRQQRPLGG